MALPATVGAGLSWSDHLSGRPGPFQRSIAELQGNGSSWSVGAVAAGARRGQTFTPAHSASASGFSFAAQQVGTARNYTAELFATSGGIPTGAALASVAFISSDVGTAQKLFRVTFAAPVSLTSGTMYALVVRPTANDLDAANYLQWIDAGGTTYSGTHVAYSTTTALWTSTANNDLVFVVHEDSAPLYVVARDNTNSNIEVWKSTDSGQTWAEANAANHKTGIASANFRSFDSVLVGTVITVAYITAANQVFFADFDTATDTWGTPVGTVISPSNVVDNTGAAPIFVARRSNGDTIIATAGNYTNMTTFRQPYYHRYVGGVWTANTVVGPGTQIFTDLRPILTDGSIIVFPYVDVANDDVFVRALSSANALGTAVTLRTTLLSAATYIVGSGVFDGAEFNFPTWTAGATATTFSNQRLTVSGSTITTVANDTVSAATITNPESLTHATVLVNASGTIHAFWINDTQTEIDRDNDAGTNTWGTDAVWKPGAYSVTDTLVTIATQPIQGATGTTEAAAQSFTPASAVDVSSVSLNLFKAGTPTDNLVIEIRSGSQTGTVLGSTTLAASGVTSPAWNAAAFASPVSLSAGTRYWLVLTRSGARDTTNYIGVRANTSASVVAGETLSTRASGVWTDNASGFDLLATIPGLLTSIAAQPVVIGGSSVGILYLEAGAIIYDSYPQSTLSTAQTFDSVAGTATGVGVAPSFAILTVAAAASGTGGVPSLAIGSLASTASGVAATPTTRVIFTSVAASASATASVASLAVAASSATASGAGLLPTIRIASLSAGATASGATTTPSLAIGSSSSAATGASSASTLSVLAASAAATGASATPATRVALSSPAATSAATGGPSSLAIGSTSASGAGTASAAAITVSAVAASAAGISATPSIAIRVTPVVSTATGVAAEPTIPALENAAYDSVAATATANASVPTIVIASVSASASANAAAPTIRVATLSVAATAASQAPTPTVRIAAPSTSGAASSVAAAPSLTVRASSLAATANGSAGIPAIAIGTPSGAASGTAFPVARLVIQTTAATASGNADVPTVPALGLAVVQSSHAIANAAASTPLPRVVFIAASASATASASPPTIALAATAATASGIASLPRLAIGSISATAAATASDPTVPLLNQFVVASVAAISTATASVPSLSVVGTAATASAAPSAPILRVLLGAAFATASADAVEPTTSVRVATIAAAALATVSDPSLQITVLAALAGAIATGGLPAIPALAPLPDPVLVLVAPAAIDILIADDEPMLVGQEGAILRTPRSARAETRTPVGTLRGRPL